MESKLRHLLNPAARSDDAAPLGCGHQQGPQGDKDGEGGATCYSVAKAVSLTSPSVARFIGPNFEV